MEAAFDQKLALAFALLQAARIWRPNYDPPFFRLARKVGIRVRPPHFVPPTWLALGFGTYFFLFLLAFKSLAQGYTALALLQACLGGAFYGLGMAVYYAMSRKRHSLPSWSDL